MTIELRTKIYQGEWTDISSESLRVYEFGEEKLADGRIRLAQCIQINHPQWLHVSASGGHRILDRDEISHYVPCGWKHLYWGVSVGAPHFVK